MFQESRCEAGFFLILGAKVKFLAMFFQAKIRLILKFFVLVQSAIITLFSD